MVSRKLYIETKHLAVRTLAKRLCVGSVRCLRLGLIGVFLFLQSAEVAAQPRFPRRIYSHPSSQSRPLRERIAMRFPRGYYPRVHAPMLQDVGSIPPQSSDFLILIFELILSEHQSKLA